MGRKLTKCTECNRIVPIKNGKLVFHHIQDKGWVNSAGKRDECDGSNQPKETALVELLREVPKGHRTEWESQWAEDGTATGHTSCPIGSLSHKAADRIAELEEYRADWLAQKIHLQDEITALKAKLARQEKYYMADRERIEELQVRIHTLTTNMPESAIALEKENFNLKAKLARVEKLPDDWERLIGIPSSSFGEKGDEDLDSVFRDLASELRQTLEQDK